MDANFKKSKLVYMMVMVTFIFVPFFAFIGIIYNDHDLSIYFDMKNLPWMSDELFSLFTSLKYMPTNAIYSYAIVSLVLFGFSLLCMMSLFFVFKHERTIEGPKYLKMRFAITFLVVIVMLALSAAMLGYSQYRFGWFNEWVTSLTGNASSADAIRTYIRTSLTLWTNVQVDHQHMTDLVNLLFTVVENPGRGFGPDFNWIGLNLVWLVVSVQILILLGTVLRTGFNVVFSIESVFERKYEDIIVKKETFNFVFLRRFLQRRLVPNEKNISIGIALTTLLTFSPQIIYISILDAGTTTESRFVDYSYVYPYLFHDGNLFNGLLSNSEIIFYYMQFQEEPGNLLLISKIPLFGIFVVLAFVWIFIYVYIKKHSISQFSFVLFFGFFVLVEMIALSLMAVSQSVVVDAVHFWNDYRLSDYILAIFNEKSINYMWLKSNELISALLLSFCFLITFSILQFSQIIKLKRKNVVKYIVTGGNVID